MSKVSGGALGCRVIKESEELIAGHVVLLGPTADDKDLAHELIHVQQFQRSPLIQPILYAYQSLHLGYRNNKYEQEAYTKSASRNYEV